eukprot:gene37607-46396_t
MTEIKSDGMTLKRKEIIRGELKKDQLVNEFERLTGMKCAPKEDGFTVPLGPDLRANI